MNSERVEGCGGMGQSELNGSFNVFPSLSSNVFRSFSYVRVVCLFVCFLFFFFGGGGVYWRATQFFSLDIEPSIKYKRKTRASDIEIKIRN